MKKAIILFTIITIVFALSLFSCQTAVVEEKKEEDNDVPVPTTVTTTDIAANLTFTVNITGTTAYGGGNVIADGGSFVTERGICWNTTGSPTISGSHDSDGSGTGVFTTASMTGLTADTIYHVRAYAVNNLGTTYGNEITFNSGKSFGTNHAGGYVFYNNGSGGGLVSAKIDQSTAQVWITGGLTATTLNGNTSIEIGTGLMNTNAIVLQSGHTGSAAQICLDYNDGTYSDWFLPSRKELNLMYTKLKVNGFGGFAASAYYWSSSELTSQYAWAQYFNDVVQGGDDKSNPTDRVRAIRSF